MTYPPESCSVYHGLQDFKVASRNNLIIGYLVKPLNPGNLPQGGLVESFQADDLLIVKGPGFAAI